MAVEVRQELAQLMNSSGSHKDLAAKYVALNRKKIASEKPLDNVNVTVISSEIAMHDAKLMLAT